MMRDPRTHRAIPVGYFLSYSTYKSFIRLTTFSNFKFATHRWKGDAREPRSIALGNILHYDMLDAAYFADKHRKRQAEYIRRTFYLMYRLAQVARNCSDSEIKEFFEKYIAIRDPARIARLERKGILLKIDAVANFMKGRH